MSLKDFIKRILDFFHLDITKNLEYDRYTKIVLKKILNKDSSTIDVGCHKGEILDIILSCSPNGKHYGFEPIPEFFDNLKEKYSAYKNVTIYPYALSNKEGETTFNYVKNAPAYSGIKERKYAEANPKIEKLSVEMKTLDGLISSNVDFIKIDVEGAEFLVLKGGVELIKKTRPVIVFEFGLGASDFYNTNPSKVFDFFKNELGYKLFTLKSFLKEKHLSKSDFLNHYNNNSEYYFVAQSVN